MSNLQEQPKPDWQQFLEDDDKAQANQKQSEKGFLKGKTRASDNSAIENKMNLDAEISKLGPLYSLFGDLPLESQDNIISDIQKRHDQGEDSRSIIAHVLELVRQHKKFADLGSVKNSGDDQSESDADKVVEEVLKKLREVRKTPGKTSSNQIDLPFTENKDSKPKTLIN